ncbi:MAG: HEPN domain-containing protein [Candidatus Caldarchaeum sp.]
MPAKFHELRRDFLAFYEKVRELLMSNSIQLPEFWGFNSHDAKNFHVEVENLREYERALRSLKECSSFKDYYSDTREIYESDDWEESDATHLRDFHWLAVEVLRSFIADSIDTGNPSEVFYTFSKFFDQRIVSATLEIQFKSAYLDLREGKIQLDQKTELVSDHNHYLLILKDFPFKLDKNIQADYKHLSIELWKILGKLFLSMFLSVSRDGRQGLTFKSILAAPFGSVGFFPSYLFFTITRISYPHDIGTYPSPFWPIRHFVHLNNLIDFFHHSPSITTSFAAENSLIIPSDKVAENWKQLSNLSAKIKGFERRLAVVGRRIPGVLSGSYEDVIIDFCILLESLLLKDGERESVSYKFAMRGALMCSSSIELMNDLREELISVYDARSSILHGRDLVLDDIKGWHWLEDRALLILYRTFVILAIKRDEIKTWDDFVEIVEKALLDRQLQNNILSIRLKF